MSKIRILVADDHGIVRKGLRFLLDRQPDMEVVGEASEGREVVRLSEELSPNIIIMDVAMPQLNGIDAAAQIIKINPSIRILMLSMYADESYLIRALGAGAKGYLLKDSAEVEIVKAVQIVSQGRLFFSSQISQSLLEEYVRTLQQRGLQDSYELLTDREREVLQLLAEGKSNKEVATILDLSTYTVETHRTNLMHKLNLHNTAEIVLYAVRKKIIT
jgi:two-component system, NarL family, response regulator NreC